MNWRRPLPWLAGVLLIIGGIGVLRHVSTTLGTVEATLHAESRILFQQSTYLGTELARLDARLADLQAAPDDARLAQARLAHDLLSVRVVDVSSLAPRFQQQVDAAPLHRLEAALLRLTSLLAQPVPPASELAGLRAELRALELPIQGYGSHVYQLSQEAAAGQALAVARLRALILYGLGALMLAALVIAAMLIAQVRQKRVLADLATRLRSISVTDELTGLGNNRGFRESLARERARAQRQPGLFSLVYFDLNRFKAVNDTHGHAAGDAVLQTVAATVRGCIRGNDMAFRYGGDEFYLILPATTAADAEHLCRRLIERLAEAPMRGVTLSIGVVQAGPEDFPDEEALLARVDRLMYDAKRDNREHDGHRLRTEAPDPR